VRAGSRPRSSLTRRAAWKSHSTFIEHAVVGTTTNGDRAGFSLGPTSVAEFHARFLDLIRSLGGTPDFHGRPNEVPNPVPFADDRIERPYDADAVTRFFLAAVAVDKVLKHFRTAYLGKVSPVHLFWGSFDLAVTRFSGRPAPLHPGGIPALPDNARVKRTATRSPPRGFGRGVGRSTVLRSILMPTLRQSASPMHIRHPTRLIMSRA